MSSDKENVIFNSKEDRSVEEIGRFLVAAGQKLIGTGTFTVVQAGREVEISPKGSTRLELKYKSKDDKQKFEIEIGWRPSNGPGVDIK